jgi:RNA polymerase sigma-70 factor (ECF subfamily)
LRVPRSEEGVAVSYALVEDARVLHSRPSRQGAADASEWNGAADADDSALAASIAAGDAAAFDELYRRYRPLAAAVALGLLHEPAAAEDAVHDAFLRFWRAARSFQPARGQLRSWLLTIVRNAAIDELRARQLARRPEVTRAQLDIHAHSGDDVVAGALARAEAERLHLALRSLPAAQRQALELAYFGGLTHSEIAARTGMPLGTVKGRVRLGLRRLRHDLGDYAWPSADMEQRQTPAA